MKDSLKYENQFKKVYLFYFSRMKKFAQQYVLREEDAENIVQDIFIELWEKKMDFSSFVNLNGYLYTVLKNRCIDFLRRKVKEQSLNNLYKESRLELKLKYESLEGLDIDLLGRPDLDKIIQDAINCLPEKCRLIFIMYKFENKKQKAIAAELNISIKTVESQMAIAYKKLYEALKSYLILLLILSI